MIRNIVNTVTRPEFVKADKGVHLVRGRPWQTNILFIQGSCNGNVTEKRIANVIRNAEQDVARITAQQIDNKRNNFDKNVNLVKNRWKA